MYDEHPSRRRDRVEALVEQAATLKRQSSRPPAPPMSPPRAAAYIQQAESQHAEGRSVEALASLTLASQAPRFAVHALRRRARIEEELGELETAITTLKEALHRTVGDAKRTGAIYTEIGDVYARREESAEASYYYRRALQLDPDDDALQTRLEWALGVGRGLDDTTSRVDIRGL